MKSNRTIRRITGKDPELTIEAYDDWRSTQTKAEVSTPCRIMEAICKDTIESIKKNKKPSTWIDIMFKAGIHLSTGYSWRKRMVMFGFVETAGWVTRSGFRVVASKKALKLYLEGVEKLYSYIGESLEDNT